MMKLKLALMVTLSIIPFLALDQVIAQQDSTSRNTPGRTRYVVIPIEGMIGGSVTASGVEEIISQTVARADHNCIIFTFDTAGGDPDEAFKISQIINRRTDGMDVVGILKKCIGPGLAILLSCDEIYLEEPLPQGIVIEFQDSWLANSSSDQHNLRRQQVLYGQLVSDKPAWKPIINALTNPDTSLYAWRDGDGLVMTSNTKPGSEVTDAVEIDLTTRLGLTAEEAIEAGLANPAIGGIEAIGASLGYQLFQKSSLRGDVVMKKAASSALEAERAVDQKITEAFEMLANAQSISGDLSRLRYRAGNNGREDDGANSRRYANGRWDYANGRRPSQVQKSAESRDRWDQVISSLDQIQTLERNARISINQLEEMAIDWPADDPRIEAIGLLNEELSELRADSYKLGNMRDEAVNEYELMDDRANPRHIDNSQYRRLIINNRGWGHGWGWGNGFYRINTVGQTSPTPGFTPYRGGGGISTTR